MSVAVLTELQTSPHLALTPPEGTGGYRSRPRWQMRTWNGFGLRGSQKSEQSWAQLVQSGDFAPSPAPFATPWGVMRGQAQGHRHQQHTRRSHGRPVRSGFCIHPPRGPYLASESQSALCLDQVSSWTNHWLGPMISETEWGALFCPLSRLAPPPQPGASPGESPGFFLG